MGRISLRFWTMLCGVSGVLRKVAWPAKLTDGGSPLGYVTPAANAAACLA